MKFYRNPSLSLVLLASAFAPALTAKPLFNGKDLTGWSGDGYVVEDGAIVCTSKGGNLVTADSFANYILEFEFKLEAGSNNGLGIHYPGNGDAAYTGMELQILDNSAAQYAKLRPDQIHGSVYTLAAAKNSGLKAVGEWNHQQVTVAGSGVVVELNGEIILRTNLDDLSYRNPTHQGAKRRSGHIALLGHGDRVSFRNIEISERSPTANTEGVLAAGYKRMMSGTTLSEWTASGETWTFTDGILAAPSTSESRLTSHATYGNCSLVFDWRWCGDSQKSSPNSNSDAMADKQVEISLGTLGGLLLTNSAKGSGQVQTKGFKTPPDPATIVNFIPKTRADKPDGEWNRTMVTIEGNILTVAMNGRVVIEGIELPENSERAPLILKPAQGQIEFANLWIQEL